MTPDSGPTPALEALAATIQARDAWTGSHSKRVAHFSVEIARELGVPPKVRDTVSAAALLHDLGKIAIPDSVLLKRGERTQAEEVILHTHPEEGARIIEALGYLDGVVLTIRHHHERWDGTGYPDGLEGDAISLPARIVAVADAYDNETCPRDGEPVSSAVALEQIRQAASLRFDPDVVAALERLIEAGTVGAGSVFDPAVVETFGRVLERAEAESHHLVAANVSLRTADVRFAEGLVAMLREGDEWMADHSQVVAVYSRDIAEQLGLAPDEQDLVFVSAQLHDIGKYRLPETLLEKAGPLSLDEQRLMEKHPEYGEQLLQKVMVDDFGTIGPIVRHHHERWDGSGYPDALIGEEIPLPSRIVAAADAVANLTFPRPPAGPLPSSKALERLRDGAGSAFDPQIVEAFSRILAPVSANHGDSESR